MDSPHTRLALTAQLLQAGSLGRHPCPAHPSHLPHLGPHRPGLGGWVPTRVEGASVDLGLDKSEADGDAEVQLLPAAPGVGQEGHEDREGRIPDHLTQK